MQATGGRSQEFSRAQLKIRNNLSVLFLPISQLLTSLVHVYVLFHKVVTDENPT